MRTTNVIANDIVRAFNRLAEKHGADIPMGDLAALIYLVESELDGVRAAALDAAPSTTPRDALIQALTRIRDAAPPRDRCHCDHSTIECCERVDEYCPVCIAAVALAADGRAVSRPATPSSPAPR